MNLLEVFNIDSTDDLAPTRRVTYGPDGGTVPGMCVGYTYDGAAYCIECADQIEIDATDDETYLMSHFPADEWDGSGFGVGVLSGFDETDYPGDSCHVCHKRLQTNII